ncbi:MAG: hypothetical protein ABMA64_28545 [Myxococcota bacterium]
MRPAELLFVYLCFGAATAALTRGPRRWFALVLWPLVLPSLLAGPSERFDTAEPTAATAPDVTQALGRLHQALALWQSAPPLSSGAIARALGELAARRDAVERLLASAAYRDSPPASLRDLHGQLTREVAAAIGRIDELVTRIHLAHYGGRAWGEVADTLAALVAAVEGVHAELERHDTL